MAKEDKIERLRQRSRFAAMEGLRSTGGFPVPPRKAMAQAKKRSKGLSYPLPPYAGVNPLLLLRWAQTEWKHLGRWQGLALPVVIIVALLTWEKEKALQDTYQLQLDRAAAKATAARLYGAHGRTPRRKKPLGFISLP